MGLGWVCYRTGFEPQRALAMQMIDFGDWLCEKRSAISGVSGTSGFPWERGKNLTGD